MPNYLTSLSAFDSFNVSLQASANNIANVNTNGYKSEYAILQSGPHDQGVQIARIAKDMNPGPAVISSIDELAARAAHESQAQGAMDRQNAYADRIGYEKANMREANSVAAWQDQEVRAYEDAVSSNVRHYLEGSNTDLPRDFINLGIMEVAYEANAAVVRTQDDMTGTILNTVA